MDKPSLWINTTARLTCYKTVFLFLINAQHFDLNYFVYLLHSWTKHYYSHMVHTRNKQPPGWGKKVNYNIRSIH